MEAPSWGPPDRFQNISSSRCHSKIYPWWSIFSGKHHSDWMNDSTKQKSLGIYLLHWQLKTFLHVRRTYFTMAVIFTAKVRPHHLEIECTFANYIMKAKFSNCISECLIGSSIFISKLRIGKCKTVGKMLAHMNKEILLIIYHLLDKQEQRFTAQAVCHPLCNCYYY